MKKLSNTETELKKDIAYTKSVYYESKLSVTTTQKPLYIDSALIYVEMLNLGTIKQFFLVPSENITNISTLKQRDFVNNKVTLKYNFEMILNIGSH